MIDELELALAQMINDIDYGEAPLFDSVVIDYNDKPSGQSTAIISIEDINNIKLGIRRQSTTIEASGIIFAIFKSDSRNTEDVITKRNKAIDLIINAMLENPTIDGAIVGKCLPKRINKRVWRSAKPEDTFKLFFTFELSFTIKGNWIQE